VKIMCSQRQDKEGKKNTGTPRNASRRKLGEKSKGGKDREGFSGRGVSGRRRFPVSRKRGNWAAHPGRRANLRGEKERVGGGYAVWKLHALRGRDRKG